jgi:hypothetical protein
MRAHSIPSGVEETPYPSVHSSHSIPDSPVGLLVEELFRAAVSWEGLSWEQALMSTQHASSIGTILLATIGGQAIDGSYG